MDNSRIYAAIDLKSFYASVKCVDYITAPPRMARYMECSVQIYEIYQRYVSLEDIGVYYFDGRKYYFATHSA